MLVPNRHGSSDSYRYGFNGKEKDDELKGEGNNYDFGARMYDSRIGRFFKVDPKWQQFPEWSPYVYALDNPIRLVDTDGEGPGDPMHHEFLTTTALSIYDAAKSKGASGKGALLIMAQASIESGYGKDAFRRGDYNLFGTMTCSTCSDFKVKNDHGRIKDFSNAGGYEASIKDYFDKKLKKWTGIADLIKKEEFTADDVNKAFYTGKYIEDKKTRNKTGHGSYNFDDVSADESVNNNKYGEGLVSQMNFFKKRLIASIDYQIEKNQSEIKTLTKNKKPENNSIPILLSPQIKDFDDLRIETLQNENNRLIEVKKDITN
jgi:RHS repeat-associated protein